MKKIYEAPTVEKIAFNYRDQVVAASAGGDNVTGDAGTNYNQQAGTCFTAEDFFQDLFTVNFFELCSRNA